MAKEYMYRGKTLDELKAMSMDELSVLFTSDVRRKIKKGFTDAEKTLLKDLDSPVIKTHCRDMIILPLMVSKRIKIHNGKEFVDVEILPQMIGHRLGEYALSRKKVKHGSVGVVGQIKK